MMHEHGSFYGHEADGHGKFKLLSALANSRSLSASEWLELEDHLRICDECREIHHQYDVLATVGMPFLAAAYARPREDEKWDEAPVRHRLLARVRQAQTAARSFEHSLFRQKSFSSYFLGSASRQWITGAVAACLLITVSLASYRLGRVTHINAKPLSSSVSDSIQRKVQELALQKESADQLLTDQAARITEIEQQSATQQQEVLRLQTALHVLEQHSAELAAAKSKSENQLLAVSQQRDSLTTQLQQAEQSYRSEQTELTSLRAEHDHALLRVTALESKIDQLTASNRDLERRVVDDDRFLASDRDIRELMGARKLYIADVFDVDSGSRPRKPFGRVFYTQNKSLIFYAFDLDRQPGVRNTSIFQVWGQKDAELTKQTRATNLGILYMDSETNRRWVLRLDDPKQLAEIDAVFVTVEPHVGSIKPTGKPLLYALLRKEANHP
jgi:hypothetical protein